MIRPRQIGLQFLVKLDFKVIAALSLASALAACAVPHASSGNVEAHSLSLAKAYQGKMLIGAAVEPYQLETEEGRLLASQFNSVVAENVMKPSRLQASEGDFNFAPADQIVDFARQHGMKIRGHTLLWYKRTPEWFWIDKDGKTADRELVLQRLKQHIDAVLHHYRGQIYAWDVVNEVVDPNQPNCLRDDQWYRVVGADYVDWAFRYAHAADPGARLFINDYSTAEPKKRECLAALIAGMLARGVPVHGIGHQMHISVFRPTLAQIDESLTRFAKLGLENQITELDMTLYQRGAYTLSDASTNLLKLQAERYGELFGVFLKHPELTAVSWWGISDAHTHLNSGLNFWRSDRPLLFDTQQQSKAAYWAVLNAAGGQ